jgi:hypothetical protein
MLVDTASRPIAGAFVFYDYSAGAKLMWPFAHYDGPYLSRTDQSGRFTVPLRLHLRFPFVTLLYPVRVHVGVYAPQLHNSCEISFERADTDSYCFQVVNESRERDFAIRDLRDDAGARFRTLWLLVYGPWGTAQGLPGQRRELIAAVRSEYDQFLAKYGNVVREHEAGDWLVPPVRDWTQEKAEGRPWRFFLQEVPFYGITMEKKLSELEQQSM